MYLPCRTRTEFSLKKGDSTPSVHPLLYYTPGDSSHNHEIDRQVLPTWQLSVNLWCSLSSKSPIENQGSIYRYSVVMYTSDLYINTTIIVETSLKILQETIMECTNCRRQLEQFVILSPMWNRYSIVICSHG